MDFLRSIQKCPPKGEGTIVDIGANNGVISIGALHSGELAKAVAIEPEPQNFSLLQRNVNQNRLEESVICLRYAVSQKKGDLPFELSDDNFGDHRVRTDPDRKHPVRELFHESKRRIITIPSDTLDNLLSSLPEPFTKTIALAWVDTQGYEGYVFRGAGNMLSKGIPVMAEIWPYGIDRAGMSREQFCGIAETYWPHYWRLRKGKFMEFPIRMLDALFEELGPGGKFENVVFIR
jgi:FkbM family methyltransferase